MAKSRDIELSVAHPYLKEIRDLLAEVGLGDSELECKHFFSGAAAYANGKIVASLSPKGLAFKLSEHRCSEVLTGGLAIPLRYFDKSPVKRGYVLFPDKNGLSKDELRSFFRECILTSNEMQSDG